MMSYRRIGCPINNTLETFGDRWSLIILRDTMFGGERRSFRSLLVGSIGLLSRSADPHHKQRVLYSLTEKAIDLVPLMAAMGSWGLRHTNPAAELASGAEVLEAGGPQLWEQFMQELRHIHLGAPPPEVSAFARMEAAYEAVVAAERRAGQAARVA